MVYQYAAVAGAVIWCGGVICIVVIVLEGISAVACRASQRAVVVYSIARDKYAWDSRDCLFICGCEAAVFRIILEARTPLVCVSYQKCMPLLGVVVRRRRVTLKGRRRDYLAHKERARLLVHARLEHFNRTYGYVYGRIAIRNTKSRWGSCSKSGNLNFSYKLFLLPPVLADYVIVHELCHLGEFNHSKRFWSLISKTIPDYVLKRRELKKILW